MRSMPRRTSPMGELASFSPKFKMERPGSNQAGDVGRIAKLVKTRDEVGKTVEQLLAVDRPVGGQATVAHQAFQAGLPGPDQPGVGRPHGVAVTSQTPGVDLRAGAQVVDGPPHIQNIFPGHAASPDDLAQELVPLIVAALQPALRVPALFEAKSVGTKHHVPQSDQGHSGMVHPIAGQTGGLGLAQMPLPRMLVPEGDPGRRRGGSDSVRDHQDGRHPIAGLDGVVDPEQAVPLALLFPCDPGLQLAGVGPVSAQAFQQPGSQFGRLGRLVRGFQGQGHRAGSHRRSSRNQGRGFQKGTAIGRQCHDWHRRFRELAGETACASIINSMDGRTQLRFGASPHFSPGGMIMAQAFFLQRVLATEKRSGHYGRGSMCALKGKGQARACPAPSVIGKPFKLSHSMY